MPKEKTASTSHFCCGDKVRVRHGVTDADYPDMPLGGWAGTIAEVHDDGMYTIQWSHETLDSIHPVFKQRCEKGGLVFDQYLLGDDDLEPDAGGPLSIEQPKHIATKPLSPKDQDDCIRMVFTTPYVLSGTTKEDWTNFLRRTLLQFKADSDKVKLHQLMKYGPSKHYWHEFVFKAYHHHQHDAIFLTGIPDVQSSLPHA